jgi:lipid-binding SYLF domain-containing protein
MRELLKSVAIVVLLMTIGCATAPKTPEEKQALVSEADAALAQLKADDPSLDGFLADAHGYAIFPSIGKGGLIVGGAYGRGVVHEKGQMIGYADMTQASVGGQIGGQSYCELIVFVNQTAMELFKSGKLNLGAQVSAVAIKSGAGLAASDHDDVVVFTRPNSGLMAEATIAGQDFSFLPKDSEAAQEQ